MVLPSHLIRHYSFCPPMRIIKLYGLKSATKLRNLFHISKPDPVSDKYPIVMKKSIIPQL